MLVPDAGLERRGHNGQRFGLDGVRGAISGAVDATAVSTVRALEDALRPRPLQHDVTIVVCRPDELPER